MKLADEIHTSHEELTLDQFKAALPPRLRKNVDPASMARINKVISDPTLREGFRDNLLTYTSVIAEGRFKIDSYIDAVKFVSCKLLGATDVRAWSITFPERLKHYTDIGTSEKDLSSVISSYRKGTLVNKIFEQTLVPNHILNADLYQKALNKLADLMMNARSEKVQGDSAGKLLDALKMPETHKIELDVNVKEDNTIQELRDSTLALVAQQKAMLVSGAMTAQEVAHSRLKVIDSDSTVIEESD